MQSNYFTVTPTSCQSTTRNKLAVFLPAGVIVPKKNSQMQPYYILLITRPSVLACDE